MSNIYLLEPHTSGKVVLHTTQGDIEVELWPKEAPKACRNFVQLCLEGYYDNTIFHRIVAGFIIQGGDPEGTGMGGESIYGKPFQDEFHTRLRFVRRGLVAMANSGIPHDNRSQFFITLDATPELQNKHTIFGKVMGDTIFNVLKIGGLEVDSNERPLYPPKITGCTIVANPFNDIAPRITAAEREAARQRELAEAKGPAVAAKPKKIKKNAALLSFGDDGPEEDDKEASFIGKVGSSHDVLDDDPTLSKEEASLGMEKDDKRPSSTSKTSRDRDREQDREAGDSKRRRTERDDDRGASTSTSKREEKLHKRKDDEDHESYNEFDRRMREQVRERMEALKRKATSSSSSSAPATTESSAPQPTSTTTAREQQKQEIAKLENDVRRMHGMDVPGESEKQKKKREAKSTVSWLQMEREKYKTRRDLGADKKRSSKKSAAQADADLLDKLAAFESKMRWSAASSSDTKGEEDEGKDSSTKKKSKKEEDGEPCELHGILGCKSCQDSVGKAMKKQRIKEARLAGETIEDEEGISEDDDDDDDDDKDWMSHKLVFEKDPSKDAAQGGRRDNLDDYVVIDPLDKAAATNAALAKQKESESRKRQSKYDAPQDRHRDDYRTSHRDGGGYGGDRRDYRDRDRNQDRSRDQSRDQSRDRSRDRDRDRQDRGQGRDRRDYRDDSRGSRSSHW